MPPREILPLRTMVLAAAMLAVAGCPAFAITGEEAAKQVAEAYGVEVLKVREDRVDNRPAWLVTFMAPGGNSNIAFQVNTIALDRETGEEILAFQHTTTGYELPGAPQYDTRLERQPQVMRRGTWR